ncbi:AMP-binding protein [Pseudorhodoplanes sp.]|uniref:AMP-binding protein n=1 Tax=Pseudorhodoplanes sp. TaxID=1934341 RepID=UPI003D09C4BA
MKHSDDALNAPMPFTVVGDPLSDYRPEHLYHFLRRSAQQFPTRTALVFKNDRITYSELNTLVLRAAAGLQRLGIARGDRIGICMPNHPIAVILYFAAMKAGATVVMMGPFYAEPALLGQARDAGLSLIVTLDENLLRAKIENVAKQASIKKVLLANPDTTRLFAGQLPKVDGDSSTTVDLSELLAFHAEPSSVSCDPLTDLAVIQYSGGTTGQPKGVMLTHGNFSAAIRQFQIILPMIGLGTDTLLAAAPFSHISGMNGVLGPAIAWAATIIVIDRFEAAETARLCISNEVTYMLGVPTMFFALIEASEKLQLKWPALKCAVSGGAALPEAAKNRFEEVIGKPLLHAYGLTETSPPATMPYPNRSIPAASCGEAVPGCEIQIRSPSDHSKILPFGEIGELCVRGPQVTLGYWDRPDLNRDAFVDGFLKTGDLAYISPNRLIYVVDRLKDIIICSGFNVYPIRVEEAIFQHPAISEAIVLGVPDAYRGETVKAFVTLREGYTLSLEQLQDFLSPLLSPIEMPKQLEIRDKLPRSPVGKLSRLKLREEIMSKKSLV